MQVQPINQNADAAVSSPPYDLTFIDHTDYLEARIEAASLNRRATEDYLVAIQARLRETKATRLMIWRDVQSVLPVVDTFNLATEFQKMTVGLRTAFVNPYPTNDEVLQFLILVAQNRGGNFRLFNDRDSAAEWLVK